MKKVIVHKRQNVIDLAIQEYGSIEGLLELAKENNLSLDEDMVVGSTLFVDASKITNKPLVGFFKEKKIVIVTGVDVFMDESEGVFNNTFDNTFN